MSARAKPWPLENLSFAYHFLGVTYLALGLVMLGLEALSLVLRESPWGFLTGVAVGLGLGWGFYRLGDPRHEPGRAEALLSVALIWLLVPALGAIPFWVSRNMSYLDALFEATSGFTTTGATALSDFSQLGYSLFFWRSLMQWFGRVRLSGAGSGFAGPSGGGRKTTFLHREHRGAKGALHPTAAHRSTKHPQGLRRPHLSSSSVLLDCGHPPFEAICNALTTLPAGGFSTPPYYFLYTKYLLANFCRASCTVNCQRTVT